MRAINKLLGIAFAAMLLVTVNLTKTQAQPGVTVSYQTFYDELQPYGTWVDDPDYGDVWVPDVEDGFQPYATNGHWVVTEYGNTWVSNYDWGWAPFHYGRWRFDDYYGWEWIPGSEWGPAWVNWRTGGDYYAWAPLGPRVSIDISFGSGYSVPDDYWICAPRAYINSPRIYDYYVPRNRVVSIIRNTTIINNVYENNNRRYIAGPRPQEIERYTHNRVQIFGLNDSNRPGRPVIQNNTVNVYRPTFVRNSSGQDRPRPTRVVDANAYRTQHPNESIANRNNGATIRHDNSSRLAQTARSTQENTGVVRVNNRGVNTPVNGGSNGNPNANGRFGNRDNNGSPTNPSNTNTNGRYGGNNTSPANNNNNVNRNNGTVTQPAQPATGAPANATPNNTNGNWRGNRGNTTTTQPAQPTNGAPANAVPNNNNNTWRGNRGNTTTQPAPNNQPEVKPTVVPNNPNPTTPNPDNGRFNRNRNRPSQASPTTQPAQQAPAVQPQQQNQDQAAAQQRQQQQAARQQQQQQSQQQRQPQGQAQSQQQPQQQQQRQQPQRPQAQPQPQKQQPQPQQQRPQRQDDRKDEKPPM